MEGLAGEITCLSKDSTGVVSVTGTVTRSGKGDGKGDNNESEMPGSPEAPSFPLRPPLMTTAPRCSTSSLLGKPPKTQTPPSPPGTAVRARVSGVCAASVADGGRRLAGKDFAYTIATAGEHQRFSKPTIGDRGTPVACSSGGETVELTRGGFMVREPGADEAPK